MRGAVFKGLTRQDTEYFDFNPAGALQERLNNDATALGSNLLSMPMQIIVHACVVMYNSQTVGSHTCVTMTDNTMYISTADSKKTVLDQMEPTCIQHVQHCFGWR